MFLVLVYWKKLIQQQSTNMRGFIPPQNSDETVFVKKAVHILEIADGLSKVQYSLFMDLRQQQLFTAQANKFPDIRVDFLCGYEGECERCIAVVYPEYEDISYYVPPIVVLKTEITDNSITHKDILGAAMGLKIKREYIGDIIIDNNSAFIICHKNIADIIIEELHGIKRSTVSFEYYDEPLTFVRKYSETKTATVASLRADSVVAALLNKSRTEAVKHIKQGNVKINHMDISQADFEVFDNDIISIKYNGKFKVFCDGTKSRKDRIFINIAKY